MDALVGIDADLAGEAQQVGPLGDHPLVEQIAGQPFAQPDLQHLLQPGLGHDEDDQGAGDSQEDEELDPELSQQLLLERIVEGALPAHEQKLRHGIGTDDQDNANHEEPIRPLAGEFRSARTKVAS